MRHARLIAFRRDDPHVVRQRPRDLLAHVEPGRVDAVVVGDRKSTRLNSSHLVISYAVFCLKKKNLNSYTSLNLIPSRQTYPTTKSPLRPALPPSRAAPPLPSTVLCPLRE